MNHGWGYEVPLGLLGWDRRRNGGASGKHWIDRHHDAKDLECKDKLLPLHMLTEYIESYELRRYKGLDHLSFRDREQELNDKYEISNDEK